MRNVLVTGSEGFIGRNLAVALSRLPDTAILGFDVGNRPEELDELVGRADWVFHLAGINRPEDPAEFTTGNVDLTDRLIELLAARKRPAPVVFTSSIQVERDNPYGTSKLRAEEALVEYSRHTGRPVCIFRLPNVFGKWSQPNYNTVVATFCHNVARGLPVQVNDPDAAIPFVYVDEVVRAFLALLEGEAPDPERHYYEVDETFTITVGRLRDLILSFRKGREAVTVPDLADPMTRYLYATYLSFLEPDDFARSADLKTDDRGWLFELVRTSGAGQIFVSQTVPGITRGNHYHDTKVEKFCVIQGRGIIRLRPTGGEDILRYEVDDKEIRIVDIPPGYTHSIENTGDKDLITLFWASEAYDPEAPDTYYEPV